MRAGFEASVEPHRRELLVHCYRMLGSAHDAEDVLQETLLRAWRAYDRYDPSRASLRTWLYRIATNACLNALESRASRPLPSSVGPAFDDPDAPLTPALDVPWLTPLPADPEAAAVERSRLRLPSSPRSSCCPRGSARRSSCARCSTCPRPRSRPRST
ncbi:hypothetical protein GCM10009819_29460 [Agromyces tropicus]|uniref:RNA polymerase sigma factor n=1 Tax=Agromyces tropicus TaxID=555371 RepID=A0ABP5GA80_9MICO